MTNDQLSALSDAIKDLKIARDKAFHYRLIGGAADGKPVLLIQKTDAGLDAAARDVRSTGKDKRMAAGRIVRDDQGLIFGIDEGNFKADAAQKCLNKEVAKEKALATHKTLLAGARMLEGDAWDRVKPGAAPLPQDTPALQTDDIGIHTRSQAQETGKKSSDKSDKKGSDYSLFLEALDTWHNRFGAGQSVALADSDRALAALDGIEQKANEWLAKHKKGFFETSKTKNRRSEVEEVAHQVQEARSKLAVLVAFARVKDTWDQEIGPVVAEDRIARAEQIAVDLEARKNDLTNLIGDTPRSQGAAQVHQAAVTAIDQGKQAKQRRIQQEKDQARSRLQDAIDHVGAVFPDPYVQLAAVDRGAEVIDPIESALLEVERVFPTQFGKPKDLIKAANATLVHVKEELEITRDLVRKAQQLEGVAQALTSIAEGPIGQDNIAQLNQGIREHTKALEAFEKLLGPRDVPPVVVRARVAIKQFAVASSGVWGKPLADLQKVVGELAAWRNGVAWADLSQARAKSDQLEVVLARAREAGVDHVDVDNAAKALDQVRLAIRDTMMGQEITEQERDAFRKGARDQSEVARVEEEKQAGVWSGKVRQGLDNDRYKLGKVLQSGSFGKVLLYQSDDPNDPPLVVKQDLGGANEVDKEWEVYQKLGAHPNIARVLGKVEVDGTSSLVMDKINGGNGKQAMEKAHGALAEGTLSAREFWGGVQHMIRGTVRGLAHMESKGLGHNDVKHLNVMINNETGEALLVDMGSARDVGTTPGAGTPMFIPPESSQSGAQRDIFAVGGMAIAAGVGGDQMPMYGHDDGARDAWAWMRAMGRLQEAPPLTSGDKAAKLSIQFKDFVRATYELDPTKRPTYAEALEHPFLADPLLPEDEAREALKKISNL